MRRRKPAASYPAAAPQPACRRGRPPVTTPTPTLPQQPSSRQRRIAGCRQDAQLVQAPAKPGGKRRCKRPWDGRPRYRGDCSSVSHLSLPWAASGTQNISKGAVAQSLRLKRRTVVNRASRDASRQQWVAQEHSTCPFVEPGKGCSTRVPASSRHTPGRLAVIDGDGGYTSVKPQHRYVTCPPWHRPPPSFRFFNSNTNIFVQLEDTTIKTECCCSMLLLNAAHRTNQSRASQQSRSALPQLSWPDFLPRGINFPNTTR